MAKTAFELIGPRAALAALACFLGAASCAASAGPGPDAGTGTGSSSTRAGAEAALLAQAEAGDEDARDRLCKIYGSASSAQGRDYVKEVRHCSGAHAAGHDRRSVSDMEAKSTMQR